MTRQSWSILTFDELVVGEEWESPRRTVTETDVVIFAGLSGDFNPLHIDHTFSKSGPFGRPIAHGLLGMSIATGLSSQAPRIDTMAFLAILEWRFLRPIVFGDTIHAVSKVESLEERMPTDVAALLRGAGASSFRMELSCRRVARKPSCEHERAIILLDPASSTRALTELPS